MYCRDNYFALKYLFRESNLLPSKFTTCSQSQIWSSQFEVGMNMRSRLWINDLIYCPLCTKHYSSCEKHLCGKKKKKGVNSFWPFVYTFFNKPLKTKTKSLTTGLFWGFFAFNQNFKSIFEMLVSRRWF